ncbi:carbamoyltransferase [Fulvivirgaceae bacterium PWU4]|uniref:Carbamoyltransferase n=1 Tax=Chryseosolibacter histidini TaxID=2782349 RepID=A0AAP2GIM4_9BACT|nr:carbamoyltransferase [Chryseosolibacter histidini]MBT1697416.1 carbamoyltransferase [Chryseosolibacter histidini]
MRILGISAFYHDSAAALIENGEIIAAAQEERFTRKKHDPGFPANAVKFCLEYSGTTLSQLDAIVFYDKPLLKFERLLETYYAFVPRGLSSFITAIPVWLKEKMFLKRLLLEELEKIEPFDRSKARLLFPEHHLSHAASAFYPSPFEEAAILTIDGVGEWATASICHGKGKDISILKELKFPHSLGLLYSAFTYFLGFKVNSGEYKLMGLAPYGVPGSEQVKKYVDIIKTRLVDIKDDGSVWLNQEFFNYATGLTMVQEDKWEKLFGFKARKPEDELQPHHCNLGLAIQEITEEAVLLMAREAKRLTQADYLCMAGGVALNCVANGKVYNARIFKDIFIQPAAGDAGGALGAAQAAYHIYFEKERVKPSALDGMKGSYLGPEYSDADVQRVVKKYGAVCKHFYNSNDLCKEVANRLSEGNVVGWMQGRMEFGPRALGGRSILGDPRNKDMQKKLNVKIKFRESFRPFAPSVLAEECGQYFEHDSASPYMLLVQPVSMQRRKPLPDGYHSFPLKEKLYHLRSDMPAITHIDFSARIQTVHAETNPRYYELVQEFKKLTGYGVIVNTSFNVRGEPIICTPEDAYRCFMRTEMDYLVVGNFVFEKKQQPAWQEKDNWKEEFTLD